MTAPSNFWTQRRARVRAEEQAEARRSEDLRQAAETQAVEAKTDEEVLAELGLPDPDTLKAGDDFAAFMSRAIPERLRRRALRRLWTSNPTLACVDGLNDYDGDFTGNGTGGEVMKTAYKVGRGYLSKIADTPSEQPATVAAAEPEVAVDAVAEQELEPEQVETARLDVDDAAGQTAPSRRMRFSFSDRTG